MQWWGYIHQNGMLQVKRFFGDMGDLDEARSSPFVLIVFQPIPAESREDAITKFKTKAEKRGLTVKKD